MRAVPGGCGRGHAGGMGPHPDDCPACGTRAGQETPEHCSRCGLGLAGPQAAELRSINAELGRLDGARDRLSARRALLITGIRPHQRRPAPSPAAMTPAPATAPGRAAPPAVYSAKRARPELSRRAAANLLLAAGALLVGIAAVVFTVVNWSGIGTGGRAAILLAVSALAASAPWPLARRGLTATAESAAAIGLALTALDAYMA